MKRRTKPNVKIKLSGPPSKGCSYQELPMHGIDRNKDDGGNHYNIEFNTVSKLLLENYETFSVNDAYTLSRGLNLPYPVIKAEFSQFVKQATAQGKIRAIPTCMDDPVYSVV